MFQIMFESLPYQFEAEVDYNDFVTGGSQNEAASEYSNLGETRSALRN